MKRTLARVCLRLWPIFCGRIPGLYGNLRGMPESLFIMLGVIHRDEEGPVLLKNWLERTGPDVITLELSHYGMRFRRERGEEYRGRVGQVAAKVREEGGPCDDRALSMLRSYIDTPYEFDVASAYAAGHGISLHLVDMDFFSYVKLQNIEDLLSEENIRTTLSGPPASNGNHEKALARLYFDKGITAAPYDREMYIRDRYMSAKIGDLMRRHPGRRFLHVCGWQHLQDPSGLYDSLSPLKVFAYDKTLCL